LSDRASAGTSTDAQRTAQSNGEPANKLDSSSNPRETADGQKAEAAHRAEDLARLREIIIRLRRIGSQITSEEFNGQDANYERDSAFGRELLYLMADNGWSRATCESIEIARSDSFETKIQIDIELDRITHEAFSGRKEQVWLPLIVLPPVRQWPRRQSAWREWLERLRGTQQPLPLLEVPDGLAALNVVDASGRPLPTLSSAEVRRRLAAAVTEIILNVAETVGLPGKPEDWISSARDRRLQLSATIYRLLRGEHVPSADLETLRVQERSQNGGSEQHTLANPGCAAPIRLSRSRRTKGPEPSRNARYQTLNPPQDRPGRAWQDIVKLIDYYALVLNSSASNHQDVVNRQLTRRALQVIRALAESTVVVVAVDLSSTPLALTLAMPSRALHLAPLSWGEQLEKDKPRDWPTIVRLLLPTNWNWILPRTRLQLDLLLATSEVDRQVEVRLPDGVALDPSQPLADRADLDIRVGQPRDVRLAQPQDPGAGRPLVISQLSALINQLVEADASSPALYQCLADAAQVKAAAVMQLLRHHRVAPPPGERAWTSEKFTAATRQFRSDLEIVSDAIHKITSARAEELAKARAHLARVWAQKEALLRVSMRRHIAKGTVAPDIVVARARMIEERSNQTRPAESRMQVRIAVTDSEHFSIARFSGRMSGLLILVVLGFFLYERFFKLGNPHVSAEVLAFVLTLFSAIQAGRIERSDRSTMRGLLAQRGAGLVVASIMPTVILAAALAFSQALTWSVVWAAACLAVQLSIQTLLNLRLRWDLRRGRGQVSARHPNGRLLYSDVPDHTHAEVLRSKWWRNTTAEALMVGREAYAYVMWGRHRTPQTLVWLLGHGDPGDDQLTSEQPGRQPTNVLGLQRSGTANESVTFVVFRDKPKLIEGLGQSENITTVDLNTDRLAPTDDFDSSIDIFLGTPRTEWQPVGSHAVTAVLATAIRHWLTVREVQLPIPPPTDSYADLQWARVRIGLRGEDLPRLRLILAAMQQLTGVRTGQHQLTQSPGTWPIVGIRAGTQRLPRILNPRPDAEEPAPGALEHDADLRRMLLASQLDVMNDGRGLHPAKDDRVSWRLMAIIPDWQYGVEHEILTGLDSQLRLVGLTYVILYGKAVVLLLGHRADGRRGLQEKDLRRIGRPAPQSSVSHPMAPKYMDEWRSSRQLGSNGEYPLLRVRMRTPDRPGATLQVIEALSEVLRERVPGSLGNEGPNVWYAHVEVASGRVAQIHFTVRLAIDPAVQLPLNVPLAKWGSDEYFSVERETLAKTIRGTGMGSSTTETQPHAPEDTVITVELLRMLESPRPAVSAGSTDST
jgi:hypothetical protein